MYYLFFSKLAIIFATIPATSCSSERSFSALRRIKTYLRSTMCQERLSSLAILNIERKYTNNLNLDNVIDAFGRNKRDQYFFWSTVNINDVPKKINFFIPFSKVINWRLLMYLHTHDVQYMERFWLKIISFIICSRLKIHTFVKQGVVIVHI